MIKVEIFVAPKVCSIHNQFSVLNKTEQLLIVVLPVWHLQALPLAAVLLPALVLLPVVLPVVLLAGLPVALLVVTVQQLTL